MCGEHSFILASRAQEVSSCSKFPRNIYSGFTSFIWVAQVSFRVKLLLVLRKSAKFISGVLLMCLGASNLRCSYVYYLICSFCFIPYCNLGSIFPPFLMICSFLTTDWHMRFCLHVMWFFFPACTCLSESHFLWILLLRSYNIFQYICDKWSYNIKTDFLFTLFMRILVWFILVLL